MVFKKKQKFNLPIPGLKDKNYDVTAVRPEKTADNGVHVDSPPPVSFFQLFRFRSKSDTIMMIFGLLGSIVTGLGTPANTFIFGSLVDTMVDRAAAAYSNRPNNTSNELPNRQMDVDFDGLNEAFLEAVMWFLIYSVILGVVIWFSTYLSVFLFNKSAQNQIYKIRSEFLRSTLNQDMEWYDLNKSNEFASRMNEDLTKLEEGLGEKVAIFLQFLVAFISSVILAFVKGWLMTFVCLVSLPLTVISMSIVAVLTGRLANREMQAYAKAGSIAEEVFSSIRTVVAFGGEKKEQDRYVENLAEAREINITKAIYSGFGFGMLWFFIYSSYSLAFWFGVGLVLDEDDNGYTPGVMFTVFFSVMMGSMSMSMSAPYIESFGIAKGAAAKVFSIIERIPKIDTLNTKGEQPDKCAGNIEFKNVRFNYPSRNDVKILQGLNLKINQGETVAVVGSSGCGKSTCLHLIQRFYDPHEGTVELDNRDIKTLNLHWLRSKIGVVGQEPVLFGTTVYENIRYGSPKATRDEIEAAAKAANAHHFINKLPNGYSTMVGERGAQMSGGQKQRIAIARALVRNPTILLLDEATSALDTASEAKVQAALEKACQGRTTIIVAHRLSTIRNADKIIVLDNGVIVETGTHKTLMEINGHYRALVDRQLGNTERDGKLQRTTSMVQEEDEDEKPIEMHPEVYERDKKDKVTIPLMKIMKWNQDEWVYILIGCICSIAAGCAMPFFSIVFGGLIEALSLPDPNEVRAETNMYSVYFLIIGVATGISSFLQIYTYGRAGEYLTQRLRVWAFAAMLRQEIGWSDDKSNGTGALCAQLSNDAAAVQGATGQRIGLILQSLATLILSIGIAMYLEWRLGLIALSFTPVLLAAIYFQVVLLRQENLGTGKALENSSKMAVEAVSNIRTVVSLGQESMFHEKYLLLLGPAVMKAKRNTHVRGLTFGLARSIMFFAYGACMMYGGHLVATENISIQTIFTVTQALIMGTMSIANSLAYGPNFQKGLMAAGKIAVLMDRVPSIRDPSEVKQKKFKETITGQVEYKDVVFSYPSRPKTIVIQGLGIEVQPGQTAALVGESGCGKSTVIQFLERFYDCSAGSVGIDGINIKSVTLSDLRGTLGIVSQEPVLFDRTIAENIAYGDNSREISRVEVMEAAKQANIHQFIVSLPLGYETRLGEKGSQLSGGQKQRIAIARALIRKPKILLLDEATSALDMESEKVVQEALDSAREGRTCITIAHRLSTIVDADVIFVIEQGQVVEQGTHKELLSKRGRYHGLFTLQSTDSK